MRNTSIPRNREWRQWRVAGTLCPSESFEDNLDVSGALFGDQNFAFQIYGIALGGSWGELSWIFSVTTYGQHCTCSQHEFPFWEYICKGILMKKSTTSWENYSTWMYSRWHQYSRFLSFLWQEAQLDSKNLDLKSLTSILTIPEAATLHSQILLIWECLLCWIEIWISRFILIESLLSVLKLEYIHRYRISKIAAVKNARQETRAILPLRPMQFTTTPHSFTYVLVQYQSLFARHTIPGYLMKTRAAQASLPLPKFPRCLGMRFLRAP